MLGGLSHNAGATPITVRPGYTGDASQSFIFGRRNINVGDYNAVFNTDNIVYGDNCFIGGLRNISLNNETTMLGTALISTRLRQIVMGYCNEPDDTSRFMIGGGWMTHHSDGTNPDGSQKYVLDSITRRTIFKVSETGNTYAYGKISARLGPTNGIDVVRLQDMNTALDEKVNKLTPASTSLLYGVTPENKNIGFATGAANVVKYAIPQRCEYGQIAMPNQVTYAPDDDQAISKRFADNNYEKLLTPVGEGKFLYEISKSVTGTIQRSLHSYGVTAQPSSIVKRTTKGQIELPDQTASAPTDDQAISKGYADANYLKGALPTIGTSTSSKDLKKIVYTAESDIPTTPEEGVEYACTDLIGEEDLVPSFINKVNGKQNLLTFDTTPTSGSTNPVTSGGIYDAISQFLTIQVSDSLMGG